MPGMTRISLWNKQKRASVDKVPVFVILFCCFCVCGCYAQLKMYMFLYFELSCIVQLLLSECARRLAGQKKRNDLMVEDGRTLQYEVCDQDSQIDRDRYEQE